MTFDQPDSDTPIDPVRLSSQLDSLGAAISEIRIHLAGSASTGDRLDHLEDMMNALAEQAVASADRLTGIERALADRSFVGATADPAAADRVIEALSQLAEQAAARDAQLRSVIDTLRSDIPVDFEPRPIDRGTDYTAHFEALEVATAAAQQRFAELFDLVSQAAALPEAAPPDLGRLETMLRGAVDGVREAAIQAGLANAEASIAAAEAAGDAIISEHAASLDAQTTQLLDAIQHAADDQAAGLFDLVSQAAAAALPEAAPPDLGRLETALRGAIDGVREAATQAGLASAEASIAAAEAAGDAIITEYAASLDAQTARLLSAIQTATDGQVAGLLDALQVSAETQVAGVLGAVRESGDEQTTRLLNAIQELAAYQLQLRAAIDASVNDEIAEMQALIDRSTADQAAQLATAIEGMTDRVSDDVSRPIVAAVTALATEIEREVERQTGTALDTLVAAVDARLTAGVAGEERVTMAALDALLQELLAEVATSTAAQTRVAVRESVDAVIAPTLRSAGRAIADAAARGASLGARKESGGGGDANAMIEAAATLAVDAANDAVRSAVEEIAQLLPGRAPGGELTAGMVSAVAGSLDDFGTRVEANLDAIGDRLSAVAELLEHLVDELGTRRRGEAMDVLRQVAAETTGSVKATNNRRRSAPRGTIQ